MSAPTSPAGLSRIDKQELLRKLLLERISRTRTEPASAAQERLWFLDRLHPGSALYGLPYAFRLHGALDARALERALGEVVRRHEPLRTTLREREGAPVQVVAPFAGFALPVQDLRGLGGAAREAEARRQVSRWAVRPFDLAAGPLFRAALLRLGGEDHVLLLGMHHVVTDEWSMGVLFRELSALYGAFREGLGSPLPEPPVRYADYVAHQRARLRGEALEGELSYWKARLAGAPALLELPTDRPRRQAQSDRGAYARAVLPRGLPERLKELGRREGATLYMVVLAAFQALLCRYGGSGDVVVGTPAAGRTRREVEELIGFFVNTLVLRTDLSGDPSLREVLRRARETTLGAYEHQELPFDRLVAELQPGRGLGHSPLFQVMFSQRDREDSELRLPGLRSHPLPCDPDTVKFDLNLAFSEGPEGLSAVVGYRAELFDRGTVERMLEHLGRVLEQVASDPGLRLSEVEVLGEAERRLVVHEWNATAAEHPRGALVHGLFEAQAARTPGAVAACFEGRTLTYAELDARANRLARYLAARGVGPEARVAIRMEPGLEMLVSVLAVLKAGGAYLPLDPAGPAARTRMMLEDGAPVALLTQAALNGAGDGLLPEGAMQVVEVDAGAAAWEALPGDAPRVAELAPENLCYVIYTSGSTGRPKGVMVPHRGVCNSIRAFSAEYRIGEGARVLFFAPLHFDASVLDVFTALCSGATLVVASREAMMPGGDLLALLRRERVTHAKFTPSALAATPRAELPELETVISTGEACSAEVVARWAPGRRFLNGYGPTETSVRVTAHETSDGTRPPPIGRPVANVRLYVLDGWGSPAPAGVAGELYIGGVAVTRGYLGRPELTAERFLPDPFGGEAGGRLYRSGDRVRWNGRGEVEFLGRMDHQVKIRGFRIEPGEVEAALAGLPGVREAAVVPREDAPGETRLVGYVVAEAGEGISAAELRRELLGRLPEYMVPAAFVALERLPLNANGKLDRRALPAPEYAAAGEARVAPGTPVEAILAGIWAETLRLERVGVTESFFELGGHSLLATRVVSRIREVFGVELPLRVLFETPTVAGLAERVEALRRAGTPAPPPVVPAGRTGALPLSFAQERLWFIDRMQPGSSTYNVPVALRLAGPLDAGALETALGEIVRRHEALRTVFAEADGAPVQRIVPFGGFALPLADLAGLGAEARETEAGRRAGEEAARPFDLAAGPLFRAGLLRLAAEDHLLLLSLHHVTSDGWSMGVLFRELAALYAAFREGRPSPLPELPVQYADFAARQREQLRGEALERQLAWWRERLADAPALLELPADHPRPPVQSFRGAGERLELPGEVPERLRALGRREGATLFMVVLGAFQALLSRYCGSEDVVVGSPVAGRTRREEEELIGFFANTLVLRTDLSGDPAFREVLQRVRETTLGAYEHQEVPFEKLVAELRPERSLSHSPLFQVAFTLEEVEEAGPALAGLETRRVEAEQTSTKYDLVLGVRVRTGGLGGVLTYGTELFEPATARRMLRHLARVLEQVAGDADLRLSALELLDAEERRLVLEEWSRTGPELAAERCIHRLFAEQTERTPAAVAVAFEGEELTYAELDARANRLAHRLRRLGVGPEVRVGICLERGPELVVAMLAVLKAGGAYVPLDPGYPADRLAYTLEDAAAAVLLTGARLEARLPRHAAAVLRLDADGPSIASEPEHAPAELAAPRNQAYVIYTSGSTGRPKGVVVEHRGVLNLLEDFQARAPLGPGDRCSVWTSPGFDVSVYEIFSPLLAGATLCVPTDELRLDGAAYLEWLAEQRVRGAYLPPFLLPEYRRWVEAHAGRARMGRLLVGVEPIPEPLLAGIRQGVPGLRVINGYGPTEATVCSTLHDVPARVGRERPAPIGRPVARTRAYVLDGGGRPCPVGVPGELHLGGVQLARGYLGRPELTAESFVPDAVSGSAGERLYRTGDRARWRPEGVLEFLGRVDRQVKVRGFRIEPGEIESVLLEDPAVEQAVVVARQEASGRRLVAYVVGEVEAAAVRERLRAKLPEHMVPGALVALPALPLTPNGKVDREALPAPERGAAEGAGEAGPRTPVEEILRGMWAEVLGVERVGIHDDFFELGGHSLLATRLASRVREAFRVELPIRAFFEAPTVAGAGGRLEALLHAEAGAAAPPVVAAPRGGGPPPLSFAQQRLWFLDRLEPGSTAYNLPLALRLRGPLDARVLERALAEIVRRHEALRTVFAGAGGEPVQVVRPAGRAPLPVVELSAAPGEAREAAALRLVAEEARRPFDLARGPLLRGLLLRLDEEEHVLLLVMHHIVSDGWSTGVLFREAAALYGAFARGEPSPLPEPEVQYADYALWQRRWLRGGALERQLAWWRERLAGAPPLLEVPTDRPRRAAPGSRGAMVERTLPAPVGERLRALARREGATLHMVLLAGVDVLLARWSGAEDVVVGSPVAGRNRRETEGLIGFFVNTLALRTDLSGDPAFRELLGRVRDTALDAYQHQDLPFEKLVEELGVERSLSHTPLFQVMFQVEDAAGAPPLADGVETELLRAGAPPVKFDLTVAARESGEGLGIGFLYREELWDASTMERIADACALLLESAASDPGRRILGLPLATEAERERVLRGWSAGACTPAPERAVHEAVAEQAARTPGAVAVACGAEALTYRELDAAANRLAHFLRARGVGPETRVGVCLERSLELPVALLGVLRAGAAYVPLDPAYPAERLAWMLEDSGAPVLLTRGALAGLRGGWAGGLVRLDSDGARIAAESDEPPAVPVHPEQLAYVIYTSGSTGTPRAVGVPHGALASHMRWMRRAFPLAPDDRVLQKTPAGFDASVWEFWAPLLEGATLVMAPPEAHRDPDELLRGARRERITVLQLVPSLLRAVLERPGLEGCGLRRLFCGGEPLPAALAARARTATGAEVVNLYGPTEVCIDSVTHVFAGERGATVPIGRPTDNVRAYVLDAAGAPLPAGFPGELHLAGAQTTRGYLGRPEHTAEQFVPDGLSGEAGARLYRTGDRVRWLADGALEFLGRVDQQVKVRGFRIEPGEVEAALEAQPGVREAAVVAREGASGLPDDRRLVGYVAATGEGGPSAAELRERLRRRLPEHMVPSAIVVLDALPRTPSGKLDRRALPEPGPAEGEGSTAPRTPTEEVVAAVFAEVLGAGRVGALDNFFELGGHSLLATRAVSRVAAALGVAVPLRALFEAQTVAELAARVDAGRHADGGVPLPPLVAVDRNAPLPLSFAQERLWFLHQMEPGGAGYHMPWPLWLRGRVDTGALERALGELARRHESLRTTFRPVERGAVQVVHPPAAARLPSVDLAGLPPEARAREARRLAGEDAARPFDLERGPLLRLALVRMAGDEHVLLACIHHVVSDGWSMGVLLRELFTLYGAFTREERSPLPPLHAQYADYAVWQRGWLAGEALRRQLRWWRERLDGAPSTLELPLDRPRPAVAGGRGRSVALRVPADVVRGLRALARRESATLYMVARAALDLLLSRWSGQEDLVVGSPIAGRTRVELEGLIGSFVNTLALRTDLSGDPTFAELLGRVRETALGAYAHQDLPFERLVEEVAPERSLSHTPLFQVMFALQNALGGELPELPGLRAEPFPGAVRTARFDLELDLGERGEELAGSLRFRADLFDDATVVRFAEQYRTLLAAVCASPGERLSRLHLLPEGEARLLAAYGTGPARGGGEPTVARRFAAQAARTPGATAVLHPEGSLTYAQLDGCAARIAGHLRRRGVAPGTTVAVCVERGPLLPAALLAVWKAGCVYLPLDPAHPAERLALLLRDSGAGPVLTESRLAASLPEHDGGVVVLDGPLDPGPAGPEADAAPDDLAYLIYTSGSTGTPKAVMVEHGQLAHTLLGSMGVLGFAPGDVVAALASAVFDISLLELVAPLLAGAAVRILPRPPALDVEELVAAAADATVLHAVPALMRRVVEVARDGRALPELRLLLVGGDTVAPDLLEEMREVFPRARTRVLYGPTEGTIVCASYPVPAAGPVAGHPLGHPLPGVRLRVRGPRGETLPVGVPGELWISGGGVARGYLGRPELAAEKFVDVSGERAYRTGDRARWRPDGVLEFLGRTDGQVKVRGFRIEPAEVEAALRGLPGVGEVVVLAREDRPGEKRLVAYVVPGSAGQPPEAYAADPQRESRARAVVPELRAALRERLPEYMLPSAFVALESLPLTPNGKVDRQALPAPDGSGEREYVAPRGALEEVLAGIWAEVLGVERVGIHDGFFELGGHSLLATQLVSRLRELRVEVPVRQVFQSSTVAGLAEFLVRGEARPGATETVARILLKLRAMSPGERAAALRAKQGGGGAGEDPGAP